MTTFQKYHKIQSIQKRHTEGPEKGKFIPGQWTCPEHEYLQDLDWVWREKVDGTNIRIHITTQSTSGWPEVEFGGRTDNAQLPAPLVAVLNQMFNTDEAKGLIMEQFEQSTLQEGVILFGEGYGAGIQKGGAYGPVNFILFDVRIGNTWLMESDVTQVACGLGVNRVPLVGRGPLWSAVNLVKSGQLVSAWPDVEPEGIVAVPSVPLFDRRGNRIIVKVKGVDYR